MNARDEHRKGAPSAVKVAVITVSDTRTVDDDESGRLLQEALHKHGHTIAAYTIVRDDPAYLRAEVKRLLVSGGVEAVITTGGTGISERDSTFEAVSGLIEKRLDGFGEIFRMLSYEQVGAAAMLSRAVAGAALGGVIVALPGSAPAVKLALEKLLVPELAHMVKLAARATRVRSSSRPPASTTAGRAVLDRSLARFAEDLCMVAAQTPALVAESWVVERYNVLRADAVTLVGEPVLASVPRYATTANVRYAELAVCAGQLVAVIGES